MALDQDTDLMGEEETNGNGNGNGHGGEPPAAETAERPSGPRRAVRIPGRSGVIR